METDHGPIIDAPAPKKRLTKRAAAIAARLEQEAAAQAQLRAEQEAAAQTQLQAAAAARAEQEAAIQAQLRAATNTANIVAQAHGATLTNTVFAATQIDRDAGSIISTENSLTPRTSATYVSPTSDAGQSIVTGLNREPPLVLATTSSSHTAMIT